MSSFHAFRRTRLARRTPRDIINLVQDYVIVPHFLKQAQNGDCLWNIPEHYQSYEVCRAVLERHPHQLEFVAHQTRELCLLAIKLDGTAIRHVREQTLELCVAAVAADWYAIEYVNPKFKLFLPQ